MPGEYRVQLLPEPVTGIVVRYLSADNSFTYSGAAGAQQPTGGTYTAVELIIENGLSVTVLARLDGFAAQPLTSVFSNPDATILAGSDTLYGHIGADTLRGFGGDDTLLGGFGADRLYGGDGSDTFLFKNSSEIVSGEVIDGGTGGSNVDRILASSYIDLSAATLVSIERHRAWRPWHQCRQFQRVPGRWRRAIGDPEHRRLGGSIEQLILVEGTAAVNGAGDSNDNVVIGNSVGDTLYGNDGADTLYGFANDDVLVGGNGADIIDSGTGDDNISGNADADLFKFAVGDGLDGVNDFSQAQGDRLVISTALAADFAAFQAAGTTVSGNAVYTFGGGTQTITLTGVNHASLVAADVVFF